jgi:hypothetical protein
MYTNSLLYIIINLQFNNHTTMKRTLLPIILIILTTNLYPQSITIDDNGIVKCVGVETGTSEVVNGNTYEVVDRDVLIQRRNDGADLTKCV